MSFVNGPFADQAQRLLRDVEASRPRNTRLAYEPKLKEWKEFCDKVHPHDEYRYQVTEPKLFIFLYYQSYRPHKERGKKRGQDGETLDQQQRFDLEQYNAVVNANLSSIVVERNTNGRAPTIQQVEDRMGDDARKNKVIGISLWKQYFAAVMNEWQRQVDHSANTLQREQIVSSRVSLLKHMVANRKADVRKANYEEKISHEVSPFLMIEKLDDLEDTLFNKNKNTKVNGVAGLRNRFAYLSTLQSVLRGESIFKCELSDLCDFTYEARREPHPYHILVMQIMTGKTNRDKTLFGRMIRHKNVNLCGIGALALYLMLRFHVTRELEQIDFTNNKQWFDLKLMVDCRAPDFESLMTSVSDQVYANVMKSICRTIGVDSNHFIHFGRSVKPTQLELEELEHSLIKVLGNWNVDVYEDRYSAKMPLKAMRVAAGYDPERGSHYIPRAQIKPPTGLSNQVFPGLAIAEQKLAAYEQATANAPRSRAVVAKKTARAFIRLLKNLSQVVLQDAAIMIHAGRKHAVFSLPVFQSQEFKAFQANLITAVAAAERNDPRDVPLDTVIPRFHHHIGTLQSTVNSGFALNNRRHDETAHQMQTLMSVMVPLAGFVQHISNFQYNPNQVAALANLTNSRAPGQQASTVRAPANDQGLPPGQSQSASMAGSNGFEPARQYQSVTEIYDVWYGRGTHSGPEGGIHSQEQRFKTRWRNHWDSATRKRFSRMKYIVAVADRLNGDLGGESIEQILCKLDELYAEQKKSLAKFELHLKSNEEDLANTINISDLTEV